MIINFRTAYVNDMGDEVTNSKAIAYAEDRKKFRKISALRKPGNLMIKQLRAKWHTERNKS